MARITTLPNDVGPNGWSLILPPRPATPPLQGNIHAEWAVIGAGFAGLAASRRLAENRPDDRIVLVEAQEVAGGTSGRNSGIAMDVPYNVGTSASALSNRPRHVRLNRAALAYLEGTIREHGIPCNWSKRGKYHAAITDRGAALGIEPVANELMTLGEPFTRLTRGELADRMGSAYFASGLYLPGCVLVDPAALVRGLADTLPKNVTLYERSPVIEFTHRGGVHLTTPQGSLTAGAVILATNGFVREFGFCGGTLINYAIYASLTRQLTDAELRHVGSDGEWGLTPANIMGGTAMRLTRDHRLFLRETVTFAPHFTRPDIDLRDVARRHAQRLSVRFPTLGTLTLQYTWAGTDAMSSNGGHAFGQPAPNVYLAVCQNGVGITKGTISGLLAADLATGRDNPLLADIVALGAPARLFPRPLLDLQLGFKSMWDQWRNHNERQ
jgi:glycine/D-amino acid oxidase-like deaminating enzyme